AQPAAAVHGRDRDHRLLALRRARRGGRGGSSREAGGAVGGGQGGGGGRRQGAGWRSGARLGGVRPGILGDYRNSQPGGAGAGGGVLGWVVGVWGCGVLVVAAGAIGAVGLYSLAAPWLASRRVDDAYASLARGDLAGAASNARSAHNLNPLSVDALLAWGAAEASRGNVAGAGHLYTKAISLQPDNWRPWYYRARLLDNVAGPKAA